MKDRSLINLERGKFICLKNVSKRAFNNSAQKKDIYFIASTSSAIFKYSFDDTINLHSNGNFESHDSVEQWHQIQCFFILIDVLLFIFKAQKLFMTLLQLQVHNKNGVFCKHIKSSFVNTSINFSSLPNKPHHKQTGNVKNEKLPKQHCGKTNGYCVMMKTPCSWHGVKTHPNEVACSSCTTSMHHLVINDFKALTTKANQKTSFLHFSDRTKPFQEIPLFLWGFLIIFILFFLHHQLESFFTVAKKHIFLLRNANKKVSFPFLKASASGCFFDLERPGKRLLQAEAAGDLVHFKAFVHLAMKEG